MLIPVNNEDVAIPAPSGRIPLRGSFHAATQLISNQDRPACNISNDLICRFLLTSFFT